MLLDDSGLAVEKALIEDMINFESATIVVADDCAVIIKSDDIYKAVLADIGDLDFYARKYGISGDICLLNMPLDAVSVLGVDACICKTYAYLNAAPPELLKLDIRRLNASLAGEVLERYHNSGIYTLDDMRGIMRQQGVFGAIADGVLAGFIGRHSDGIMGMLEVREDYRRRGIGSGLEKFLINYVMSFGRVPICDVIVGNDASTALQKSIGMTETHNYTFWTHIPPR